MVCGNMVGYGDIIVWVKCTILLKLYLILMHENVETGGVHDSNNWLGGWFNVI